MDLDEGRTEDVRKNGARPSEPRQYDFPLRLGRYTLTELLGYGGMAEVFLALQDGPAGFQKKVVVKRIHPHLVRDQMFVQMFQREARVAAQLAHPNLVQIFELGDDDGQQYIVMEHIDGLSTHKIARRAWALKKSLPLEVIAGILADAALGLHHAHNAGIIHRDVSPENLMISTEGVTKVLDFGVAKPQRGSTLTEIGEIKGKLPFMAPEQVRGDWLDGRADVYALGVSAYWMLTGKRPITAPNDMHLLSLIMTEQPAKPSILNPAVPEPFDDLVMAMLAKKREDRPSSAREVHDALMDYAPARIRLAAPFVAEMIAAAHVPTNSDEPPSGEGFVPSSPQTERVLARWNRLQNAGAADPHHSPLVTPPPHPIEPPTKDLSAIRPRRKLKLNAILAGVVGVVAIGAIAIVATREPQPPPPVSAAPIAAPRPAPAEPVAVVESPEEIPVAPVEQPDAKPAPKRIVARAPAHVLWQTPGGKVLGRGNATFETTGGRVVAFDTRRGVRTSMPAKSLLDYASAPRGQLDLRAFPYAEVFAGKQSLGETPLKPIDVVAGTWKLKFVLNEKSEMRTVEVEPGKTARVTVDFRK